MTTLRIRSLDALLLLGLITLGFFGKATGQALAGEPAAPAISGSWAIGSIRTSDITPAQVRALFDQDLVDIDAGVCDYAFADIAGDGFYRLLVTVDSGGNRWCTNLEIIANDGTDQEIHISNVEHIADILVKDAGRDTLRVPVPFTDYEGARSCTAVIPTYYRFSGEAFVTATAEHAADYQALREKLSSAPPADICSEVVADKVNRLLGDKTAGFSHARAWMESSDPSVRRKAVRVFEDIGDSASLAALKVLSADKDPVVAMEARATVGQ